MMDMRILKLCKLSIFLAPALIQAADLSKAYDMEDASHIIQRDLLKGVILHEMPKSCDINDEKRIARGKYLFNNLNGEVSENEPPEGIERVIENDHVGGKPVQVAKQYGNCIACHDIEGGIGAGNIGPSLIEYRKIFLDTKVRDVSYVYQKIADSRIDNNATQMTINLTTGLFNESEICDLTAYVVADKSKRK